MGNRSIASDFSIAPPRDLRDCPWWKPKTVSLVGSIPAQDRILQRFVPQLLQSFREQGHEVLPKSDGGVNLLLSFGNIPDGSSPTAERVPERDLPLALTLMREFGLKRRPDNLVLLVSIPERLSTRPHLEVAELARLAMARMGSPKMVFLSGDRETGNLFETTFCTLEGGHPSDTQQLAERLRDRLVTSASAKEIGADYEVREGAVTRERWECSPIPSVLVEAGKRMDRLQLLPAPKRIGEYVSGKMARIYEHYLGMKGFSEGMLFAYDPGTQTMMVTASGSWDVDKRALQPDEVVMVGGLKDGKLQVLAPPGVRTKGPSVEALEMFSLLQSVPRVRVREAAPGAWRLDPAGTVEVPLIRAGIHVHVGVNSADEYWIESIPANRKLYPYGFGCGTDLMCGLAQDAARRSRAISDPADPRAYVRWPMLYHGDTAIELWKPGVPDTPLQGLLDLYDPTKVRAILYSPDHIDQPV
ncbi:MAG: hypothetical protein ABSF61_02435 [Anaerolineales bacterium]